MKGTLFSAVAVELAFGYSSAPLQGKSFRKAVSAVMDDLGLFNSIIEQLTP